MDFLPIIRTEEKDSVYPKGTLRVWIGNRFVGRLIPQEKEFLLDGSDPYTFKSNLDIIQHTFDARNISWINDYIRASLTKFISDISII